MSDIPTVIRDKDGRIVKSRIFGLDVYIGSCLKVVYGRYCWYLRVEAFTENPTRVIGKDIYDNNVVINLSKATLVMTINEEEYYSKKFSIAQRMKEKEEKILKKEEEVKEEKPKRRTKKRKEELEVKSEGEVKKENGDTQKSL